MFTLDWILNAVNGTGCASVWRVILGLGHRVGLWFGRALGNSQILILHFNIIAGTG